MEPESKTATEVILHTLVVYAHPRDYPNGFVVRRWRVVRGEPEPVPDSLGVGFASLERARDWIEQHYPGMVRMARSPDDDPCIAEVYL